MGFLSAIGSIAGNFIPGLPPGVGSAIGSTIGGAIEGDDASSNAADAQVRATDRASDQTLQATRESNQLIKDQYNQNRADQAPYREVGQGALYNLRDLTQPGGQLARNFSMGDFSADPGYQFRLQQGEQALNRGAAAAGRFDSGRALKDLISFNSGNASQEYGNAYNRFNNDNTTRYNRLASLAGVGQQATNQTGAFGQSYANSVAGNNINAAGVVGSNTIGAGNARASGYIGSANAVNNGISNAFNQYQSGQYLNSLLPRQPVSFGVNDSFFGGTGGSGD